MPQNPIKAEETHRKMDEDIKKRNADPEWRRKYNEALRGTMMKTGWFVIPTLVSMAYFQ
jgi:hypothetical protein